MRFILQGCSSLFGHIPRRSFYLFLVKTGRNRSNHHIAALKLSYIRKIMYFCLPSTLGMVGTKQGLTPAFVHSMSDYITDKY